VHGWFFHPPFYRTLRGANPECHLVFIERVEKIWGFTFISDVSYTSDKFADALVKGRNRAMRSIYGDHDVYNL
jgi:hypothetical protein